MSNLAAEQENQRTVSPLQEWGTAALFSMGVALAILAPFFWLGTASGHDIAFHMASWVDAAGQWKQGIILPRWTEWANFGFGEPRFVFYPPFSWLFGAFLGTILPWNSVAAAFIFAVQSLAGVSAYALLRRMADSRFAALLGTACFAANPYSLLIVYMRSDFAELLAMAFFPLLFLAALRVAGLLPSKEGAPGRQIVLLALFFSAVWLSNAPAAVVATYSLALLLAMAALLRRSFAPVLAGAAGMALGFALACFYLLPAIYEQRWVEISGALAGGLTPAANFLYAHTSDAEHDAFNRIASRCAVLLMAWSACVALAAWRQRSRASEVSGLLVTMVVLGVSAALLMFPFTAVFWQHLPELRFLQFPWRWMSMLAVCVAIFTTVSARGRLRSVWLVASLVIATATAHYLVARAWWDTEDMPTLQAAIRSATGFEGTDEYDPEGDDHMTLPQEEARAHLMGAAGEAGGVKIEKWTAEHRVIRVATQQGGKLVVKLLDYPAWGATVNGEPAVVYHRDENAEMILAVPAGRSEIHIDFTRTADRTLGGCISAASGLAALAILAWPRRRSENEWS